LCLQDQLFYNHRIEVLGGVMAEQSAELLRRFFQSRRLAGAQFGSPD
jgi:tRNA(adenine34) deaminase